MDKLIKRDYSQEMMSRFDENMKFAKTLINSKLLPPGVDTPEKILVIMLKAKELNIPTMEALQSINIISGRTSLSGQLMLAMARRSGELEDIQLDYADIDGACTCMIRRKGYSPITTKFGPTEAKLMGLFSLNKEGKVAREQYVKQPKVMYQWRAISANLRISFGDVCEGLYTPDELGANIEIQDDGSEIVSSIPKETEEQKVERYIIEISNLKTLLECNKFYELNKDEIKYFIDENKLKISESYGIKIKELKEKLEGNKDATDISQGTN